MKDFPKNLKEKLKGGARETFFPLKYTCELCKRETFGSLFCPDCEREIVKNDGICCPVCGRRVFGAGVCSECKNLRPLFERAFSPLVYERGSAALVLKFKNGGAYLAEYLSSLIAQKLEGQQFDLIVPVPASKKALKRRGYDQTALLAKELSKKLNIPYIAAVDSVKDTAEQKTLTQRGRAENLIGAFRVVKRKEIKGKRALILDDVMTTGATLDEMARVLTNAGAASVKAATIASVELEKAATIPH